MTRAPEPTGRLVPATTAADGTGGVDLVLARTFRAPISDVWASVTEPDRTARWYGRWEGDAAPGRTIKVQLAFEGQTPWTDMRIEACEPPTRLALSTSDAFGDWHIELLLAETPDGTTELRLVHHLADASGIGEIGPGWEYYLDMLVAARDDSPRPDFDAYYPAQRPYFEAQADAR